MISRVLVALFALFALFALGGCGDDNNETSTRAGDPLRLPLLRAVGDTANGGRFVDAEGRHVILRGVNVNAYVEYWAGTPFPITFPFTEDDARMISEIGWNVVRLLGSWSRIEPEPGIYDEDYLEQLEEAVEILARHGIYSLVDLHQDAWGPTLASDPNEVCGPGSLPAIGWDGAPGWATLDGDRPRCEPGGTRDLSPAVVASFRAFWANAEGPGGVGIRTRYADMIGHIARRFSKLDSVAGYDLMNEPSALRPADEQGLADMHGEALAEIRASEAAEGLPPHIVFFEPSGLWATFFNTPILFPNDGNIAYAPHLYQGGLSGLAGSPIAEQFDVAVSDAAFFDGAPILTGEWGSGPERAEDPNDTYFRDHQDLQDQYLMSATQWTWRESCGDAHKARAYQNGEIATVWGAFEVDCRDNSITGRREAMIAQLTRTYLRAAPGRIDTMHFDSSTGAFTANGVDAIAGQELVLFDAEAQHGVATVSVEGLTAVTRHEAPGGNALHTAVADGGAWRFSIAAR